jgi:cytidyltransferase-like protein
MYRIGLAQGRFHIIHWGHIEYFLKAKEKCHYLIVGITDCDPERSYFKYDDIYRFDQENPLTPFRSSDDPVFPFTYYDRMKMIRDSLIASGVNPIEFDIVPFPIHKPHLLKYYIPLDVTILITIYDDWGRYKAEMLKKMGFTIDILWERDMSTRFTTATEVRRRIINNEKWDNLVPEVVYKYITQNQLDKILQDLG